MALILEYKKYLLKFKFEAGTSRGVLKTKEVWFMRIHDPKGPSTFGIGEVNTIERLSFDYSVDFESELEALKLALAGADSPQSQQEVYQLVNRKVSPLRPAMRFGLETALLDLMHGGKFRLFHNEFYGAQSGIPINGLIWMGDKHVMKKQIDEKIAQGYSCIKLKIGAIDFEAECDLLGYIRSNYSTEQLTLRVDANGAFTTQEVLKKLEKLATFDLHSIEQPIMPKQPEAMSLVCEKSPIPVALDEELIGVFDRREKKELLMEIKPNYIILKPALLGGFVATSEWIELAEAHGIGWWITSALESNIGLNAICQFTAGQKYVGHQGLGTGQLFENNIHSPLAIKGEEIHYNQTLSWDYSEIKFN